MNKNKTFLDENGKIVFSNLVDLKAKTNAQNNDLI